MRAYDKNEMHFKTCAHQTFYLGKQDS